MNAAMGKRLSVLEREAKAKDPQQAIVCTPIQGTPQQYHTFIAPGVYVSSHGYRDTKLARSICYSDLPLLREWLALPEQATDRRTIYRITSQAEFDAVIAKIEEDI